MIFFCLICKKIKAYLTFWHFSVNGTSIFPYLCEQEFYMEYTVASLMQQLFQALEHIHRLEIAHLDIEVSGVIFHYFCRIM